MHHFALRGKLELLDRLFDRKPARIVRLVVMVAHIAADIAQQVKVHPLVNATSARALCFYRDRSNRYRRVCERVCLSSRFPRDFTQRGFFDPLAFFDMSFGQAPAITHVNQGDFEIIAVFPIDDAARGEFPDGPSVVFFWRRGHRHLFPKPAEISRAAGDSGTAMISGTA